MKIDLCIPFRLNDNINEYSTNKNSLIYNLIIDDNLRDWGLFAYIMFPQTDNNIIKKHLALFFRFFYNIKNSDIDKIKKIIKFINNDNIIKLDDNENIIKLDDSDLDIYTIIKNTYDISHNIKWKKLFLDHLYKIVDKKGTTYHHNIYDKILYFGSDIIILITQIFTPIFLNNDFIYSFGLVIIIINDLYNLNMDNDNFNLNNIYFLYSDNQIKCIINLFNHHISIINNHSNIYYYKSLIYNFALWKSITTKNHNINITSCV